LLDGIHIKYRLDGGALKMQDLTLQDLTMTDQISRSDNGGPKSNENARPDNDGPLSSLSRFVGQVAK